MSLILITNNSRKSGSLVTPEQRAEAITQVGIFKDWVSNHVIGEDSASIMIVAVGSPGPNYRDESPPPWVLPFILLRFYCPRA